MLDWLHQPHSMLHFRPVYNATMKMCTFENDKRATLFSCVHSTLTDRRNRRAVCTQDVIQPTAVDACAADDVAS